MSSKYGAPYGLVNSMVLPVRAEEGRRRTMHGWEEIGLIKDKCDLVVAEVENLFVATEIAAIINVHNELLEGGARV